MTALDLHRWITVADACRRLGMRAVDGRAWLRARGLVQRVVVPGRRRPAQRVYLAALVSALDATSQPAPRPAPRQRPRLVPSLDELRLR